MVMRNLLASDAGRTNKVGHTHISGFCRICNAFQLLTVLTCDWKKFLAPRKPLIQELFPYLSDGERELLITGICSECFDLATAEQEEGEA